MCVTAYPSHMSATTLYGGTAVKDGLRVHVIGYQNTVVNMYPGANMMILPIPAVPDTVGPHSFFDTERAPHVLDDMVEALRVAAPRTRSATFGAVAKGVAMQVFNSGIYTIALGHEVTAEALEEAMERVPAHKRPLPNWDVLLAYPQLYAGWTLAYCCFNNADAARATPLLYRYQPLDVGSTRVFLPALDAHTGRPPLPGEPVVVDHTVILQADDFGGAPVYYRNDIGGMERYLPKHVVGLQLLGERLPNGDFTADVTDVDTRGNLQVARTNSSRLALPPAAPFLV